MDGSFRFTEEIHFSEIQLIETVGKGAFGVVSKGRWRDKYVAVKVIESDSEKRAFLVEVRQLSRVSHPNIVKLYGACTQSPVCLVMEYAEGGSLYNVLHNSPKVSYNGGHAMSWGLQCARGVEYLHNMKPKALIHRDLKPPNLLLVNQGIVLKICDFGTACDLQTNMTNSKGSAAWMAPEVFEGNRYSEKCDVFSWAIIMWEVLARQKPFNDIGCSAFRIMWAVHTGKRPSLLQNCPKPIEDLITRSWAKDPDIRPSMTKIVKIMTILSKFFTGGDQPIFTPSNCDCISSEEDDSLCSLSNRSYESSASDLYIKNQLVHSPSSITVVSKQNPFKEQPSSMNILRNSNTAPASLANSQENLTQGAHSPHKNASPEVIAQQKRRSADFSHMFKPPSLTNGINAPVQQRPPSFIIGSPTNRSLSVGSTSIQSKISSPDTGRGSSLTSSNPPSFYNDSLNNYNKTLMVNPEVPAPRRLHRFSNLDPQFQPLTPMNNCPESMAIYEEHKRIAQEFIHVKMEISLLVSRKDEIIKELTEDDHDENKSFKFNLDYIELQNEKDSLTKACECWTQELDALKSKQNPQHANFYRSNSIEQTVNDDGWVVV
ncbi:Mitogen-activated protein kinase kinase kinase 7 [Nymphon striatum]|nr:Mitogen-activated protein kinase kinase kinase 7 [Nymphon striatum]